MKQSPYTPRTRGDWLSSQVPLNAAQVAVTVKVAYLVFPSPTASHSSSHFLTSAYSLCIFSEDFRDTLLRRQQCFLLALLLYHRFTTFSLSLKMEGSQSFVLYFKYGLQWVTRVLRFKNASFFAVLSPVCSITSLSLCESGIRCIGKTKTICVERNFALHVAAILILLQVVKCGPKSELVKHH